MTAGIPGSELAIQRESPWANSPTFGSSSELDGGPSHFGLLRASRVISESLIHQLKPSRRRAVATVLRHAVGGRAMFNEIRS
jgi:hypothetical protein